MSLLRSFTVVLSFLVFALPIFAKDSQLSNSQSTITTTNVVSTDNVVKSININSADAKSLQKIKGIGKKKAQAIVKYRGKNGPFNTLEDLLKVKCRGINKKWLDKISKFLTV